ncbi:MAG: endolytic transglycosylase MltG [Rhodothermales bacterium]|nr:endolytic transglycosylase MltG [Rhodothermales bacterium]
MRKTFVRVLVVLVVLGAAVAGTAAWMAFSANTPEFEDERTVKLPSGSSLEAIQDSLVSNGILANRWTFDVVARGTGWGDQIKSGHYAFEAGLSNIDLLGKLRRGEETPVRLTIRSGTRKDFVARSVAAEMAFSEEAFLAALADPEFTASIGTDTAHVFGFMLPDTYFFYWESSPQTVITEVKKTFDRFYEGALERAAASGAPASRLSKDDVTNMAAIVEWEAGIEEEKPTIAGVYLNRLRDRWPLQADPTVQYALIQLEGSKRRLFNRDYRIEHPYNTYKFQGLPPGPVTNPTRTSIEAVLAPESHGYYFFVARGDGSHLFSRTLGEHRRNAQAYFRVMRERRAARAAEAAAAESGS